MDNALAPAVYLVEDSLALRERLRELLALAGNVRIVGEASSPDEAVAGIRRAHPDIVVLDYQLDGGTGLDVLNATAVEPDRPEFIVLTNHVDAYTRRVCREAGARHFLDKSTEFLRIGAIVAELHQQNRHPSPNAVR